MVLNTDELSRILFGYVVPIVVVFGISGNLLNLTVLLAKKLRTRSNTLLAYLAMIDIIFLLSFLPDAMANHQTFEMDFFFRKFYHYSTTYRLHAQNWFSAAAIWLILIICADRLIGIRNPLSSRIHSKFMAPRFIAAATIIFTGILTSHYHLNFVCKSRTFCNGTQFHGICRPLDSKSWFSGERPPEAWQLFAKYSLEVQALVIVFLPVLLVVLSNGLLLWTLRQRTQFLKMGAVSAEMTSNQMKKEQRVTFTVCAIVTCFSITQAPSAFVPVWIAVSGQTQADFSTATIITSTMVILGKALNFILFCLSSANFRQRLLFRTKELATNSAIKTNLQASTKWLSVDFKSLSRPGSRPVSRPSSRLSLWPMDAGYEPVHNFSHSPVHGCARAAMFRRRSTAGHAYMPGRVRSAPRLDALDEILPIARVTSSNRV
ncbi:unnamed protein product, partial [Mesorhabditis spiculigera]